MCVDMGFQSFTTVSFLSTTLFSVRDADSQAGINKITRFFYCDLGEEGQNIAS
jgi:hypothetical protein